jgi:hypothetical protein
LSIHCHRDLGRFPGTFPEFSQDLQAGRNETFRTQVENAGRLPAIDLAVGRNRWLD